MPPNDLTHHPIRVPINLLRCPRTGARLEVVGDELMAGAERYPIVNGKPVLVRDVRDVHVTPPPPSKISQNIASFEIPAFAAAADRVLHLGSGNVPCSDPRVISMDILPCENADIVAEAEALPFADETFDYVASSAVFEHLYDPIAAIREIKRVLRPGGRFCIDTAFLQGYHGFPSHYFNMTPQAIEAVLVDDFELEAAEVPPSATPAVTVIDLIERFLRVMPPAESVRMRALTVDTLLSELRSAPPAMDDYAARSLAASFVVVARKPLQRQGNDTPQEIRREYYAARMEVLLRAHEITYYRSRARPDPSISEPPQLEALRHRVADTEGLAKLRACESELRRIRDLWIARYQQG